MHNNGRFYISNELLQIVSYVWGNQISRWFSLDNVWLYDLNFEIKMCR